MLGGLFALKVIPALFAFGFEITISRLQTWSDVVRGKSSESVQCAITGPCLRMRHRPSA